MKSFPGLNQLLEMHNSLLIIVITFFCSQNLCYSQRSLEKFLRKAAQNTYTEGTFSYSLQYKTLTPSLDTFTDVYSVLLSNIKKDFSFKTSHRDSLSEIYFNNLSLRCNKNTKTYWLQNFEHDDALSEFEGVYQPFADIAFNDYFVDDSVLIEKVLEDKDKSILKVTLPDDEDVGELYSFVTISKNTNTISEYGLHASVGGVGIYNSWKILSKSQKYKEPDSSAVIKQLFYKTVQTFKPFCANASQGTAKSSEEEKLTSAELQGILPSLHLVSTNRDTLVLNQLKSKYYLVDFWFRSCYPCIKTVPILKELHGKYDETYLKIVSINNVDKSIDLIEDFKADNGIPYQVYMESTEYGKKFDSIHAYPTFIIFDNNFNVLKTIEGYSDDLMSKIEEVIKSN